MRGWPRWARLTLAAVCLVLGLAGLILPIMPGVVFLLLAFALLDAPLRERLRRWALRVPGLATVVARLPLEGVGGNPDATPANPDYPRSILDLKPTSHGPLDPPPPGTNGPTEGPVPARRRRWPWVLGAVLLGAAAAAYGVSTWRATPTTIPVERRTLAEEVEVSGTVEATRAVVLKAVGRGTVAFSAAVHIFFGAYPANKASRLEPVEAPRYE